MAGRVVVLNDTDVNGYHFGCTHVMSILRGELAKRHVSVSGSVKVGLNPLRFAPELIKSADLIVVNGEGTLHHGAPIGGLLLEAAASHKARGGKVALINALWQDNPQKWADLVSDFDVLACRDSRSAAELAQQTGRKDVRMLGDLSMLHPLGGYDDSRSGVVFSDSVYKNISLRMVQISSQVPGSQTIPVKSSLKKVSPGLTGMRRKIRSAYAAMKQRSYQKKHKNVVFLKDTSSYIAEIKSRSLLVTGRFHGVCLAIAARTPFIAIPSNSWKIEALIQDVGLSQKRIVPIDDLRPDILSPDDWGFDQQERTAIDDTLLFWNRNAAEMFDDIAALA